MTISGSSLPAQGIRTAISAAGTRFTPAAFAFTWTDGTPTSAATATATGLFFAGINNGFTITAPADTTERVLKVYVGAYGAKLKMQAALSDASATDYLDTSFDQVPASEVGKMWTFTYKAAAAGQTILITCSLDTLNQGGNSSITLQAATLSGTAPAPTATYPAEGVYTSVSTPTLAKPALKVQYDNTEYGTKGKRITSNIVSPYAKSQPWSKDMTWVRLNSNQLYDAATWNFVRSLSITNEAVWSQLDNNRMFNLSNNTLRAFDVRDNSSIPIRTFVNPNGNSAMYLGPSEGNMSDNDTRIAMVTGFTNSSGTGSVIVYDLPSDTILAQKTIIELGYPSNLVDWVSISPSGNYVVISGSGTDRRVNLYDANLNFIRQLWAVSEHGDMGWDQAGNEVMCQVATSGKNHEMCKLATGVVTTFFPHTVAGVVVNGGHLSMRNWKNSKNASGKGSGWAVLDTGASRECIAVKLDGAPGGVYTTMRYHHTRTTDVGSQGMTVPSPDLSLCMFKSDNMINGTGGSTSIIDTYISGMVLP
jgi:hypothetical protein